MNKKDLAKAIVAYSLRNTSIEDIHSGIAPVSHTGDFSDVVVVDAAGNKYSLVSQGNASAPVSSSGLGVRPPASLQPPAPAGFGAKAGSFFDRLLNNEKAMGLAIQGLGQGLTAAQANKAQQEALDWQKKRYTATGNFRVVQ